MKTSENPCDEKLAENVKSAHSSCFKSLRILFA